MVESISMELALFSVAGAVVLWGLTQVNLWMVYRKLVREKNESWARTDEKIEKAMATLRTELKMVISDSVNTLKQGFPSIDQKSLSDGFDKKIAEIQSKIEASQGEVSNKVISYLGGEVERLRGDIAVTLQTMQADTVESMKKYLASKASADVRQLQAELKGIVPNIENLGNMMAGELQQNLNPVNMQALKVLNTHVSEEYAEANPIGAMIVELGKAGLMQAVQKGAIPGLPGGGTINTGQANAAARQLPLSPYGNK